MKRFLSILTVFMLVLSSCVWAQAEGVWQNGAFVLGESGYKLVLPENMDPISPYPNELAAAMTPSYTPPDGMGIVVYTSPADALTEAQQQYQLVLVNGSGGTKPENIYSKEKSANALADWAATFHSGIPTEYCEMDFWTGANEQIPYVLTMNNQVANHILQAIMVVMIPGKTQCYPIYISRLFSIEGMATAEQIQSFREELLLNLDTLILSTKESADEKSVAQRINRMPYVDMDGLSDDNQALAQIYNNTLDQIMENAAGGTSTGVVYYFSKDDEDSILRSSAIAFSNTYASKQGQWTGNREDSSETLDYFWDLLQERTRINDSVDAVLPTTEKELVLEDQIQPVELLTQLNSGVDAVLFGLQDVYGNWAEGRVYLLVRIAMTQDQTVLCLVTDEETIAQYLQSIGRDLEVLRPQAPVMQPSANVGISRLPVLSEEWSYWLQEHNRIVDMTLEDGCSVSLENEFIFAYDKHSGETPLHPVVMVLSSEAQAAEQSCEATIKDWKKMFDIVLQHAQDHTILPMEEELFFKLTEGSVSPEAVFYGQGDVEYLVFMIADSQTGEPLDDQLYALLRVLSPDGTVHMSLITDQEMIRQEIQQSMNGDETVKETLTLSPVLPEVEAEPVDQQEAQREAAVLEYEELLDETANDLLYNIGRDSYFRGAVSTVLSAKDSWVHNFAKKTYDFTTDPFGYVVEGIDKMKGEITVQQTSEDLMVEILREMLSGMESGVEKDLLDHTTSGISSFGGIVAQVGRLYSDLDPITDFIDDITDIITEVNGLRGTYGNLDAEYRQLTEIAETTARYTVLLHSIREACKGEAFIVNACNRLLQDIAGKVQGFNLDRSSMITDHQDNELKKKALEEGIKKLVEEVAGKAGTGTFGAVLLASDIGAFLTNQSAILSEKEDLLVQLAYINTKVVGLTDRALDTEHAYPMLELRAAVQMRGLYEADLYYTAYSNTYNGWWNTTFNGFDIDEVKTGIQKQRTSISSRIQELRRKHELLDMK